MQIEIPGYSIVSTLSEGSEATVYLALENTRRRELALKVMALDTEQIYLPLDIFVRERLQMQRMVHPNIVKILDAGIHAGHSYLAMEYIPGSTLSHKRFELDLLARLRVMIDIARALDFIAERGYVHGNLLPENILLHAHDNRAILLDFGLSQIVAAGGGRIALFPASRSPAKSSGAGFAVNYSFLSPEQLQGRVPDRRSDLYSLGALFFLLLTDALPFSGNLSGESNLAARQNIPQLPGYLQAFQPVLDRLLHPQPEARYQRAGECIVDLGALPESAVQIAIEGFESSLVTDTESPLQLMSQAAAAMKSGGSADTAITADTEPESAEAFFIDSEALSLKNNINLDTSRLLEPTSVRPYEDLPLILIAAIGLVIPLFIYYAGQNLSAPAAASIKALPPAKIDVQSARVNAQMKSSAQPDQAHLTRPVKITVAAEPDLAAQAAALRVQLEEDFSLATDLVVIYRAALRGEDPDEHAFARAGLIELQQLFSKRIQQHIAEKKLEIAVAERDLAWQLFEPEELLAELKDNSAAIK